jgi:predicted Na+-dependent transporter
MSATVDIDHLRRQLRNRNALLTGISLQFFILPFLGFAVVKLLRMNAPMGITLLVITSSPGGSYSNWWCSMFNADLALSVTMTAISTLLSVIMLPVNLILYATNSYSSAVVKSLDWYSLFVSLVVVIGAISTGLICSARNNSHQFNLTANKVCPCLGPSM